MPTTILLTGASGQVGSAIRTLLTGRDDLQLITPTSAELNLADPTAIRAFVQQTRPRWIVNPAAYTAVDRAESEPALAHAINAVAPGILGEEARKLDATVLHFSTDYVFDGTATAPYTEQATPNPQSVYGASKLAGEEALATSGAAHLILRTSWVYGAAGKNFLLTILKIARERPELKIVADQHGAPTAAVDLAHLIAHILTGNVDLPTQGGIYHATAIGETTWHGFATEAIRQARLLAPGTHFTEPQPISTSDYPTPAPRPRNSRLDCTKLEGALGFRFPPWQQSLALVMTQLHAATRP